MAIPVTADDVARHLRLRPDELTGEQSAQIITWIDDAIAWIEGYTGHILIARDVTEQFARLDRVELAAWPVKPAAVPSISFYDRAGAAVAVTGARVASFRRPATILPAAGSRWPIVGVGPVTVTVRAGYEPNDVVPGAIRRAMLVLIAAYDADREAGDIFAKAEMAARGLCNRANLRLRRL